MTKNKRRRLTGCFGVLALLVLALGISVSALRETEIQEKTEQQAFDALAEIRADRFVPGQTTVSRFDRLAAENDDFAAWLSIEGTGIDYPVMLSPEDPDFYLTRDFHGQDSVSGTPYIGRNCDLDSDNILIYGHNMGNGTMFSDLLRYEKKSFFEKHPRITLETEEGRQDCRILAVFRDRVYYQDEKAFKYYDYAGDLTEEEFREYVETCKEKSLVDTGTEAVCGDQLITLSTCAYHTKNGRFVLVAVKN